jgi:hypothetical protein
MLAPSQVENDSAYCGRQSTHCTGFRLYRTKTEGLNLTSGASELDFGSQEVKTAHFRTGAYQSVMQARRALFHLLLALFLLLGQQAAFSHAATHFGGAPAKQDQKLPDGKACDQCVQAAQLGAALLDSCHADDWSASALASGDSVPGTVCVPRLVRSFLSRAPPASS